MCALPAGHDFQRAGAWLRIFSVGHRARGKGSLNREDWNIPEKKDNCGPKAPQMLGTNGIQIIGERKVGEYIQSPKERVPKAQPMTS